MSDEVLMLIRDWLQNINKNLERIAKALEGEKSVSGGSKSGSSEAAVTSLDSDSIPYIDPDHHSQVVGSKPSTTATQTKVVQTQNFVDVRECKDYSEKSYKLIGYDNRETYIAKQHVIRTESIEGGGTRVITAIKSAWVITKLEWK